MPIRWPESAESTVSAASPSSPGALASVQSTVSTASTVSTIRPYPLPTLAAASVGSLNALARYGNRLPWPDANGRGGQGRVTVHVAPAGDAGTVHDGVYANETSGANADVESDKEDGIVFRLRGDGGSLQVVVPHAALAAWVTEVFAGVKSLDLCGWVRDAAADCLLDSLRPWLRTMGLPPGWQLTRATDRERGNFAQPWRGYLDIVMPDVQDEWRLALSADDGGLQWLARCLPRNALTGRDVEADQVPIPLRAMVGYTDLSLGALRRLAPGDVVLLDQEFGGRGGEVCLRAPDGRALRLAPVTPDVAGDRVGLPAPYLIVADWISIMSPEEKESYPEDDGHWDVDTDGFDDDEYDGDKHADDAAEDDDVDASADAPDDVDTDGDTEVDTDVDTDVDGSGYGGADDGRDGERRTANLADDGLSAAAITAAPREDDAFDAIPVRLGFDLGARTMPLGEVRQLRPGETLILDSEIASAPISLRANGKCIGHGELVEIDGRLGVRIIDLRRTRT